MLAVVSGEGRRCTYVTTNAARRCCLVATRALRTGRLDITVTDDGVGFVPDSPLHRAGQGLTGMQDRSAAFSGAVAVRSGPGQGTTVLATIVVAASRAEAYESPRSASRRPGGLKPLARAGLEPEPCHAPFRSYPGSDPRPNTPWWPRVRPGRSRRTAFRSTRATPRACGENHLAWATFSILPPPVRGRPTPPSSTRVTPLGEARRAAL